MKTFNGLDYLNLFITFTRICVGTLSSSVHLPRHRTDNNISIYLQLRPTDLNGVFPEGSLAKRINHVGLDLISKTFSLIIGNRP